MACMTLLSMTDVGPRSGRDRFVLRAEVRRSSGQVPVSGPGLAHCDEVLGAMPTETHAMRRAAMRSLLSGRAPSIDEAAAAAEVDSEKARAAVALVVSVGMAEVEGELIVGMDGLTIRPTPHRLALDGAQLWTWCAYDIVGIAGALGADAVGHTSCGSCGLEIEVVVKEGLPEGQWIGWLPNEVCSNVRTEFCPTALFFCSREHLDAWRRAAGADQGEALSLGDLAERGRVTWRDLVG